MRYLPSVLLLAIVAVPGVLAHEIKQVYVPAWAKPSELTAEARLVPAGGELDFRSGFDQPIDQFHTVSLGKEPGHLGTAGEVSIGVMPRLSSPCDQTNAATGAIDEVTITDTGFLTLWSACPDIDLSITGETQSPLLWQDFQDTLAIGQKLPLAENFSPAILLDRPFRQDQTINVIFGVQQPVRRYNDLDRLLHE